MDTFILKGKPKQTVTLEVDGHSLTFTEDIEIAVFVVVAAQQSFAVDGATCASKLPGLSANDPANCPTCGKPHRH